MNDVNGPPSQVEPRPTGEHRGTPRSSFSETPMAFESYAKGLVRKISDNLHQAVLVEALSMCPLRVWRGEWRQRRVFVLEIMLHTHESTITNCCAVIGISSLSQKKSKIWLRKQSSIISILSEFLLPNDVALELWIWMTVGNFLFWCWS